METGGLKILADGPGRFNVVGGGHHTLPPGIHLAQGGSLEPGPAPGIFRPGFCGGGPPIPLFKNRPEKHRPPVSHGRQMLHLRLSGLEKLSACDFYDAPGHHLAVLAVPQTFSRRHLYGRRRRIVPFELSLLPANLVGKNQKGPVHIPV